MIEDNFSFKQVVDFGNLYKAYKNSKKGKDLQKVELNSRCLL